MKTERPHHSQVEECKKWDEEAAAEVAAETERYPGIATEEEATEAVEKLTGKKGKK